MNVNQQNRLHPHYPIFIGNDDHAIVNHTEVKRLLDLVRAACKGCAEPVPSAYEPFNRNTDDGRNMQMYSGPLADAIRSIIDLKEEKDLDSLFTSPKTTALTGTIKGLDDFELIALLVVQ